MDNPVSPRCGRQWVEFRLSEVLTIPKNLSEIGCRDLSGAPKFEIPLVRAVASIIHECNSLDIKWRIGGDDVDNLSNLPTVVSTNRKVAAMKGLPNPFTNPAPLDTYPNKAAAAANILNLSKPTRGA